MHMIGGRVPDGRGIHNFILENCKNEYYRKLTLKDRGDMDKHSAGVSSYKTDEGKRVLIPFKGPIKNTILGGIRSTCTYVGVKNLPELSDNTVFIRVTQQLNEIYGKS